MPQLQINQGPQDALLYDNTRSYFTNVGYVRTSNFQMELRDIEATNQADLGTTAQWVIPKAADLLGAVDLIVKFNKVSSSSSDLNDNTYAAWVETLGYAMIDKITFSVGSTDIETLQGEHLNIINELMRSETQRYAKMIGKTGRSPVQFVTAAHASASAAEDAQAFIDENRMIAYKSGSQTDEDGKELIVPLGLFFTKHPSQYFPLAAIAGCNDVRITIKFRQKEDLIVLGNLDRKMSYDDDDKGGINLTDTAPAQATLMPQWSNKVMNTCKLRCHYIHVTGPEATTLMNKEHVRLMKLYSNAGPYYMSAKSTDSNAKWSMDLSFLHPVQELIITIRKRSELNNSSDGKVQFSDDDQKAHGKNWFAYHGSGNDPNIESLRNRVTTYAGKDGKTAYTYGALFTGSVAKNTVKVKGFKLTLNGQERHPGLDNDVGIDRDYLMDRMMPMLHSNTADTYQEVSSQSGCIVDGSELDFRLLQEMKDRKEIYVYPFALNPEGANPSGAVNFSKVSHAKFTINYDAVQTSSSDVDYQVDVYGVYYNWLQIKDGRALLSFA